MAESSMKHQQQYDNALLRHQKNRQHGSNSWFFNRALRNQCIRILRVYSGTLFWQEYWEERLLYHLLWLLLSEEWSKTGKYSY